MIDRDFWSTQRTRSRGNVKLDETSVRRIKTRIQAGDTLASIARDEQIGASTVGDIKSGQNWGWV